MSTTLQLSITLYLLLTVAEE